MNVQLNGKETELQDVRTVGELIRSKGLKPSMVAVEFNGDVLPRDRFDEQPISDGDRLEIVHAVQGGT